jgi:hypothetical protein
MASYRLAVRHDTAANWTSADPVLAQGEFGYETDTGKIKIGDSATSWSSLAYFADDISNDYVDSHLNTDSASTGDFLSWDGSDYVWTIPNSGGAQTFTDLTATASFTSPGIDDNATTTQLTIEDGSSVFNNDTKVSRAHRYGTAFSVENTSTGGKAWELRSTGVDNLLGTGDLQFNVDSNSSLTLKADRSAEFSGDLTASGKVGIGTDSPDGTLHVKDTIAQLYVQSNDGQPSQVVFGDVTDASGGMIEYTSTDAMAFKTNNLNERMRIDASGNVGIGTATPVSTNNYGGLTLNGASGGALSFTDDDVLVGNLLSSGSDMYFGTGGDTVFRNGGYTGSDEAMRIDSSGNVGINTTNPSIYGGLVIAQDANTSSDGFAVVDSTLAQSAKLWCDGTNSYLSSGNTGNDPLILNTGGGNVGIGTADPDNPLHLKGGVGLLKLERAAGAGGACAMTFTNSTDTGRYITGSDTTMTFGSTTSPDDLSVVTEHMRISSTGLVGIGTDDPNEFLHIEGAAPAIALGNTSGTTDWRMQNVDNSVRWVSNPRAGGAAAERMRIDASGNLLVGRTSTSAAATDYGTQLYSTGVIYQYSVVTGASDIHRWYNGAGTKIAYLQGDGDLIITGTYSPSDERLKENIVDAPAGNLDDLRVRSYDWKADGSSVTHGFIAQELEVVAPYAVNKGETEDDMMAVDYSKLVPMLVKEIQDLKAKVEALENA